MSRRFGWAAVAVVVALAAPPARAEDARGRWSLGFGLGIQSTIDDIRSNAANVVLTEAGIPGDPADDIPKIDESDRRQDDLLGRETAVDERQVQSLSVAYGLTSWLSLQFDLGYYRGDVSNLDTFRVSHSYGDFNQNGQFEASEATRTPDHDASIPISLGRLEQIPLSLSAVFRFRKDSPFNPIMGAGVGMIFTDFEESRAFQELNDTILEGFRTTQVWVTTNGERAINDQMIFDGSGNQIGSTTCADINNAAQEEKTNCDLGLAGKAGLIPSRPFITSHVEDAFEYHLMGGAEYYFNERWSAFVLGRYTFTGANLSVRISDNGNRVTSNVSSTEPIRFDVEQARFHFLSSNVQVNPASGMLEQGEGPGKYPDRPAEDILVQGGEINLSGFSLNFGVRFTF